jgi:hypothetical protein
MKDAIKQFVDLKTRLTKEREVLMGRLAEINGALGEEAAVEQPRSMPTQPKRETKAPKTSAPRRQKGRAKNPISLREAVVKVTSSRALTKQEIIDAVQGLGYKFRGSDPKNVLGTVIYGKNPRFKNEGGKFSPV